MNTDLIISLSGIIIFLAVCIVKSIQISKLKKKNSSPSKPEAPYIGSIVVSAIAELLPLLIPLSTPVIAVVCLCGILGALIVFNERIGTL